MISKKIKMFTLASILSLGALGGVALASKVSPSYVEAAEQGTKLTAHITPTQGTYFAKQANVKVNDAGDTRFKNGYNCKIERTTDGLGGSFWTFYLGNAIGNEDLKNQFKFHVIYSVQIKFDIVDPSDQKGEGTINFIANDKTTKFYFENINEHQNGLAIGGSNQPMYNDVTDFSLDSTTAILSKVTEINISYYCI